MVILASLTSFFSAVLLTILVRRYAFHHRILDVPSSMRKIHTMPTPLLGGVAVVSAFLLGLIIAWPVLTRGYLLPKHLIGVMVGACFLLWGGILDDRKSLPPRTQIIFPILAALVVITAGIGIPYISNPFGNVLRLDTMTIEIFRIHHIPYHLTLIADLFTFCWLLGMMYTTKFLDGLDGLVSSVTIVGCIILFVLSLSPRVGQPETAIVALLAACAFAGFLFFNWHPAKIFLGESGALFAGFLLGTLAIISGGKIATALLIMGLPILDVAWVLGRRLFWERRSPFHGDQLHLHFRLIQAGIGHRRVVLLLTLLSALFGASSLILQSPHKLIALGFLAGVMLVFIFSTAVVLKLKQKKQPDA